MDRMGPLASLARTRRMSKVPPKLIKISAVLALVLSFRDTDRGARNRNDVMSGLVLVLYHIPQGLNLNFVFSSGVPLQKSHFHHQPLFYFINHISKTYNHGPVQGILVAAQPSCCQAWQAVWPG